MKTLYQFLIVCSLFLLSLQVNCNNVGITSFSDVEQCMTDNVENSGFTCCFYNGTWKETGFWDRCAEFSKDEVTDHRKEVKKKLLGGNYWSQVTNDSEIMSNIGLFYCKTDRDARSNYITIGLLAFVSLLFLLF